MNDHRSPSLLVALLLLTLSSVAQAQPLWLHVTGDDEQAVATTKFLTQRLRKAKFQVLAGDEILPTPRPSQQSSKELGLLLREVESAFHGGRAQEALTRLAAAQKLVQAFPRQAYKSRIEIEVWHCAIHQSLGDNDKARDHALRALALDRDLIIDLERYWPSLAEFFEKHRQEVSSARLRLTELPPRAEIWIDGRQVPREIELAVGAHSVFAQAQGYESRTIEINLLSDTSIALALEHPVDAALEGAQPLQSAELLCQEAAQTLCVFVSKGSDWRAIVIDSRGKRLQRVAHTAASLPALGSLLDSQFVVRRREKSRNIYVKAGVQLFANQGLSASWGASKVEQKSESGGIILGLGWRNRSRQEGAFAMFDVALKRIFEPRISHQGLESNLPARGATSWAVSSELRAGYRSSFGNNRFSVSPQLALLFDTYRYRDVEMAGTQLRAFAPTTSIALAPSIEMDLRVNSRVSLGARFSFGVFSAYLETPTGYGESGAPSMGSARGHASWRLSERWEIETSASVFGHASEFSGEGNANLTPAPQDTNFNFVDARLELSLYRRL